MTKIVRIVIASSTAWTSIQVPSGSELVWAEPATGVIVGGQTNGITTYWKTSEYSYGQERCLIRRGPLVDIPAPGEPETDYVEPGLPGATPFVNADYLIWWKKSMYDAYPTNQGQSS